VLLSTEYVRHDIAMQILGDHLGSEQVTRLVRSDPEFVRLRSSRSGAATWGVGAPRDPERSRTGHGAPAARHPASAEASVTSLPAAEDDPAAPKKKPRRRAAQS
jgi:hypothetical protein